MEAKKKKRRREKRYTARSPRKRKRDGRRGK